MTVFRPDSTAICSQTDPELFFPDAGGAAAAQAKHLCQSCPLIDPCLEYALGVSVDGVWGGTSFRQRSRMRTAMGIVAKPVLLPELGEHLAKCGTEAGCQAHRRRGEKPCVPCVEAAASAAGYRRWRSRAAI